MNLWRDITNLKIGKVLRMGRGAVIKVVNSDNTESTVDLTELAALDGIAAADLAKIDSITNGTGAAGKALVLDSSGNVAMPDNGAIALSRAAVAAAGTDATNATALVDQVNAVTASDGTKGVALPAAATTTGPIYVINTVLTSGANLLVYPVNGGNDNINGGAEDAAFTMGPGKAAWFIPTSATQWYVEDASGVLTTTTEANYLDITTLGTGAASKAVVLDANGNYTMPDNGFIDLSNAAVAAAGSGQSTYTAIADQVNAVTGADATKGVALPAASAGRAILIINTDQTNTLPVAPVNGGNDAINGLTAGTGVFTMGPARAAWFIPTSATQWYVTGDAAIVGTPTEQDMDGRLATVAEINRTCDISARVVTTTATALSLTVTEHADRVVLVNTNSTVANTFTLPVATGSGAKFTIINNIQQTQGTIVVAANGTDVMTGVAIIGDTTAETAGAFLTTATSDKLSMDLTTTGGLGGDQVELLDGAANVWTVRATLTGSGTLATPFSQT